MTKSTLTWALVFGLVGSALAQVDPLQQTQQAANGLLGNLGGALGNQMNRQGQPPSQGLLGGLSNLLGSQQMPQRPQMNNQMMPGQQQFGGANGGGLTNMLQQLPERGLQMISQLMSSVRNLLPGGLGRNGSMMPQQQQLQMQQFPNPQQGLNLQGLTAPLNELTQGRLPNMNQLTQQLPNVNQLTQQVPNLADSLVPGLGRTLSNIVPQANGNANNLPQAMNQIGRQ